MSVVLYTMVVLLSRLNIHIFVVSDNRLSVLYTRERFQTADRQEAKSRMGDDVEGLDL